MTVTVHSPRLLAGERLGVMAAVSVAVSMAYIITLALSLVARSEGAE